MMSSNHDKLIIGTKMAVNGVATKSTSSSSIPVPSSSSSSSQQQQQQQQQRIMLLGTITTIVIRSLSFLGTQYCIRTFHTPITLGTNVQLELIMTAILFLSREGFRLAITNTTTQGTATAATTTTTTTTTPSNSKNSNNDTLQLGGSGVALLTIPVTFIMSMMALLCHIYYCTYHNHPNDNDITSSSYTMAGIYYCIAAFIEGCGEPIILYTLQHCSVTEKASAEGIGTMMKTISIIVLSSSSLSSSSNSNSTVFYHWTNQPLIVLGMAQIMYAISYCIILYGTIYQRGQLGHVIPFFYDSKKSTTTTTTTKSPTATAPKIIIWWHIPTIRLVILFTLQGILKFILTEGDRIVLSIVANNYNQGLYALGCAYGGLAARLLLQPIEETSRLLYSRLAITYTTTEGTNVTTTTAPKESRKQQQRNDHTPSMLEVSYTVLVKMVLYIGLIFCCLGVNYTYILLNILAGRTWGDNPEAVMVLSSFCVYTAFLAWNGMTEAFMYGISQTASDIGRLGIAHTVTGGLFAIIAPIAITRYGTLGLVTSNCITMLTRTGFSIYFAARYFSQKEGTTITHATIRLLRKMIPVPMVLALFIISFFGTQQSSHRMMATIAAGNIAPTSLPWFRLAVEHIGVGVAFGVGILSTAYGLENDFRHSIRSLGHEKKD